MIDLIWLIPLLPLAGFLINGLGRNTLSRPVIACVGCGVVLLAFLISSSIFLDIYKLRAAGESGSFTISLFDWFSVGNLSVGLNFLVDPLSIIMLLIITGVGALIHIYSIGYMKKDPGFGKYFAFLNLFIFFMLLLVLGSNYLVMFIGWEGVGLCSYLLIGFWYKKDAFAAAGRKAFIMNRIGDLGFLLAVFFMFVTFGTIEFDGVFNQAAAFTQGDGVLVAITLLLFIAATGKSAQIPLFTWLPDAMAGPTPVSALIHAATMVTAGIYMIARSNILFFLSPVTLSVIAVIGLATAILAAAIALTQNDIKKVLAYSTVSQLGYMFLGLGVGAFTAAFFHVITHAFFKALLFLGAGSVIHAMHDDQDMRSMGGLRKHMPVTFITMLIATIAIAGIPPLSGFFSKDEILAHAFDHNKLLWVGGFIGALFTAFYMFRLLYLTFYGKFRGTMEQKDHLHESPKVMTIPLVILAVFAALAGCINLPEALGGNQSLSQFLAPVFTHAGVESVSVLHMTHSTEYILMGLSALGGVFMAVLAYRTYVKQARIPASDSSERNLLSRLSYNRFYVDEIYDICIVRPFGHLSRLLYRWVDRSGIDGIVRVVAKAAPESGKGLRLLQGGNVGLYLFLMILGIVGLLLYGFFNI